MRCCQSTCQEITMQAGLALLRCGTCGSQTWTRHGNRLPRAEAFALLARTYQDVPAQHRAARVAALAATEARRAERAALAARRAAPEPVDAAELLKGWTVLGASA